MMTTYLKNNQKSTNKMETPTKNQEIEKPVIVDPEEFGLTIKKGSEIEGTFSPLKTEYDALLKVYELIVNSEITSEVCERARRCRIDAGKQIKKVSDVHKVEKAVFWNGGLYVDAIKNRDTFLLELIKIGSKKIEDHYLIIEQKRIEKVGEKRTKELSKFTKEIPGDIGGMRIQIYDTFLAGAKATHYARIEDEKKAKQERIEADKAEKEKQELLKKENDRLKEEAARRDRLAKIESDKRAKVEADRLEEEAKREDDLQPYITFIRDYSKMIKLPEKEYQKELKDTKRAANDQWEYDRKEKEKEYKIQQDQQSILDKAQKEKEKAVAELQTKKDAESLKKKQDQDKIQADLNRDDAAKITDLIDDLDTLMTKYSFESEKNKVKYVGVKNLLLKVILYIKE